LCRCCWHSGDFIGAFFNREDFMRFEFKKVFISMCLIMLLASCDQNAPQQRERLPVSIEAGDECHLCGMIISRFPGPKGEAFTRHNEKALMFCSTVDLFSWLLQPDVTGQVEAVYVHDMGQTSWEHPQDDAFIDARQAWYVAGSDRRGAMGPALAAFAEQHAAAEFARQHGGRVIAYRDIDLELLQSL
jgi:copper chaperone NosL